MYSFIRDRIAVTLIAVFLCSSAQAASDGHEWSGIFSASIGNDDNLTLEDDSSTVASGLDDNYLEILGYASRYISGVRNDGLRISGTLFTRQYESENDYTFSLLGAGVGYDKTFSDWKARFEAGYDYIEYGSETYERVTKLGVEGRRRLTKKTELRLRYEANFIDAGQNFTERDGTRQFVRAETRIKQGSNRYRLSYTFQTNDRDDSRTATTFSSSSPERHILRANARIPFNSKWKGEVDVRYRMSRYRDSELFSDGTTKTREDDRFRSRLGIEYKLADKTKLFGRYDYYDNDSNIDTKSYTRNLISTGVQLTF
jgi:hypothetical protein